MLWTKIPRPLPSIALLLIKSKRINATELLDKTKSSANEQFKSFGRNYDSRLSDIAERIPDVDVEHALREGEADLRHLPFVTMRS